MALVPSGSARVLLRVRQARRLERQQCPVRRRRIPGSRGRTLFYVSGRTGRPGSNKAGTCATGLATLRRDGFASMDAGETGGTLTTRPVRFSGKHLFVNVDNAKGELRVEILDQ